MKKLLFSLVVLLGIGMAGKAEAAGEYRGARQMTNINYSTAVSSISVSGPAVVYAVIQGTGTAGTDYTVLFDVASIGGTALASLTGLKAKVVVSSATQDTITTFNPPLQFNSGIVAVQSATTNWTGIVYERGRLPY